MTAVATPRRFADSLFEHRRAAGLTLQEVSDAVGIPMTTLSHWECAYPGAKLAGVVALADFFNVSLDEMAGRPR